ncbi:MAG: ABC transporter permease, partial [Alphaproteobacteria bacterium]
MGRYLAGRLIQTTMVMLAMSLAVYLLIGLMPGDPIDLMVSGDPRITPADAERLRALHGLDRPLWDRYLAWLGPALGGDLGYSRLHAQPVLAVLIPYLGNTALLMGLSFFLAVALALPLGSWAARREGGPADHAINLLCVAGSA